MIKFLASSRIARVLSVLILTFVTVALWGVSAHAADTTTTVKINANGSKTTCTYQKDFVTTLDGSHMFRTAWVCITSK